MIKGAQKQMIVVRTGNSRYFDEAYFVLRRDIRPRKGEEDDMISEANRILAEHEATRPRPKRRRLWSILLFGAGILLGCGVTACLFLIF